MSNLKTILSKNSKQELIELLLSLAITSHEMHERISVMAGKERLDIDQLYKRLGQIEGTEDLKFETEWYIECRLTELFEASIKADLNPKAGLEFVLAVYKSLDTIYGISTYIESIETPFEEEGVQAFMHYANKLKRADAQKLLEAFVAIDNWNVGQYLENAFGGKQ